MSLHASLFYNDLNADVAIVGAGISGLTAAYYILKNHPTLHILILEASDRIGGRSISEPLLKENGSKIFDSGRQWITSQQEALLDLIDELSIDTEMTEEQGKVVVDYKGKVHVQKKKDPFKFCNIAAKLEMASFVRKIENLCQKAQFTDELANMNMEFYINRNLSYKINKAIVRLVILMNCGVEPRDVTVGFYVFFCISVHGIANQLSFGRDGLRELVIQNGAQEICEKIVTKFKNDFTLLCNTEVTEINKDSHYVHIVSKNESVFYCDYVIVAVPPTAILQIKFTPQLPEPAAEAFTHSFSGNLSSFVATYNEAFWKKSDYSGDIYSLGNQPIVCCFDATTLTSPPKLSGYATENGGDAEGLILRQLARYFGDEALHPVEIVVRQGQSGSPMFCNRSFPIQIGTERIFWAGAETSMEWYGSIAGGVLAGKRAAYELIHEMRPSSLSADDVQKLKPPISEILKRRRTYNTVYKKVVNPYYQISAAVLLLVVTILWRNGVGSLIRK